MKRNTAIALLVIAAGIAGVLVSTHYQLRGFIALHILIILAGLYRLTISSL
ncbi:hypothetical protein [Enterobacter hormaechei]|uniref:hypothetical protein n=1 Tax=Enterobacter hormaechei TaxID=158836 RepID=UPI000AD029A7|nr:hypothetical protein [Enterobacter hormaechei]